MRRWMCACLVVTACGHTAQPAKPATPAPAPAPEAAATPPRAAPAPPAAAAAEVVDLPAGLTLADVLPAVPVPVPRLASSANAALAMPRTGCSDLGPEGAALVRRVELPVAPQAKGELPGVLELCLFSKVIGHASAADSAKQWIAVAAWPGDAVQQTTFEPLRHAPENLPPERQKAGHDAVSWGALLATGDPTMPALVVVSARSFDGELGEIVHYQRQARLLRPVAGKLTWEPLLERSFETVDLPHLEALCAGKADASAADRAAGALQVACDQVSQVSEALTKAAASRLGLRQKRLKGGGDAADPAQDPDPQSLWLRDARKALHKNNVAEALTLALQVDVVCGEACAEAHALIQEALAAQQVSVQKPKPAQPLVDLCEPLVDKTPPRRVRADPPKVDAKAKTPGGAKDRAP